MTIKARKTLYNYKTRKALQPNLTSHTRNTQWTLNKGCKGSFL